MRQHRRIHLVWRSKPRSKIKGKIHWECIAFSSFLCLFRFCFFSFCFRFVGRTLNYHWLNKKNHYTIGNRRERSKIESWGKKHTNRTKLNRETMHNKPLLFKWSPTNENRSTANRFVRIRIVWSSLRLPRHRYYIIINIICWLTKHKYFSFVLFFSLFSWFFVATTCFTVSMKIIQWLYRFFLSHLS